MKEINKNNIEAWFLDYFEGRLNEEEKKVFWKYLREHRELFAKFWEDEPFMRGSWKFFLQNEINIKNDLQLFSTPTNFKFDLKTSYLYSATSQPLLGRSFKHQIFDSIYSKNKVNWENQCIAYLEGDLEQGKREEFEEMLRLFPRLRKDLELFKKAVFKPEPIKFPHKASLYRKNVSLVYRIGLVAAAAVLALIVLFYPAHINNPVLKQSENSVIATNTHPNPQKKPLPADQSSPQNLVAATYSPNVPKISHEAVTARPSESLTPLPSIASSVMVEHSMTRPEIQPINRVYTAIYADMMERWQAEAQRENRSIISTLVKPVKGLLGKAEETLPGHNPVSIWTLAEFTIKGFNTLTNNDLELKTLRDEQGRIRALAFGNENFRIAHLSKQREASDAERPQAGQRENDSGPDNP